MKYARSVIKTPTYKFIIVGSAIPEKLNKVYSTEAEAKSELALYEIWEKFNTLTDEYIARTVKPA